MSSARPFRCGVGSTYDRISSPVPELRRFAPLSTSLTARENQPYPSLKLSLPTTGWPLDRDRHRS